MTETEKAIKAERLRIRRRIAQELRRALKNMKYCNQQNNYLLESCFWDEAQNLVKIAKIIGK